MWGAFGTIEQMKKTELLPRPFIITPGFIDLGECIKAWIVLETAFVSQRLLSEWLVRHGEAEGKSWYYHHPLPEILMFSGCRWCLRILCGSRCMICMCRSFKSNVHFWDCVCFLCMLHENICVKYMLFFPPFSSFLFSVYFKWSRRK